MEESLLSVGIDLGTSTTQLVFSRLRVKNRAAPFAVPDVQITDKEILYKSEIHFTPLRSDTVIDTGAVKNIIAREYEKAAIRKEDVATGAVIITGETARKENAREVLRTLSGFAGDFVVATAGPDLESVLAGAGAGADVFSRENRCSLLHFDIGGGTTNMVFYVNGEIQATGCLNVGGRLIKISDGKISYVSPVLKGLCKLNTGQDATRECLAPVVKLLAQALEDMALGQKECVPPSLRTTALMELPDGIDYFSFSGGVADLIYTDAPPSDFTYGDIGVLLGQAIRRSRLFSHPHITPKETIRATVVGAGSHSTQLSGSTIAFSAVEFPMKNLPVLSLGKEEEPLSPGELALAVKKKLGWFSASEEKQVVIALQGEKNPRFEDVNRLAEGLLQGAEGLSPLLIVVEADMGKALGQAILARAPKRSLVCLDGVRLQTGAYLDIGSPVAGGSALPVVIKTLIFDR